MARPRKTKERGEDAAAVPAAAGGGGQQTEAGVQLPPGVDEESILEEIRDRFTYASDGWREIQEEGAIDMRFASGDPWDPDARAEREKQKRICISVDELGQYYNQLINDVRANPRSPRFAPVGNGANDQTARWYQNKWREVEYRSKASIAYTTAFQDAVQRGYGWCRVSTEYVSPRSMDQELVVQMVADPDSVFADPDAKRPDSADMKYLFAVESRATKEFTRQFPHARHTSFGAEELRLAPLWFKGEGRIQLGEYWTIATHRRELLRLKPPPPSAQDPRPQPLDVFVDELQAQPSADLILGRRSVDEPCVYQYLTNGFEILEVTRWRGKHIPFVSCFGKVIYVKEGGLTKRKILSMTRLARDPQMLYAYYRTKQAEISAMAPLAPVAAYEGQMDGYEDDWAKAAREPMPFLYFKGKTTDTGAQVLPPPSRLNYDGAEHLQALELAAEGARRAIQAAMGVSPLPTQAQRRNEKSGVALKTMESAGQRGSFHFVDHYDDLVERVGVIGEDLMDKTYDTARDVGVRLPDGSAEQTRVNDPRDPKSISTAGDHQVTVSTGPSNESEREAASDFADTLVGLPDVFRLIAPDVVRLKNLGPIGDKIADDLEVLRPPELRKQPDGKAPLPPEARAAVARAHQAEQKLQQASQIIQNETVKVQGQAAIERMKLDAGARLQIALKRMDLAAKIEAARITASKQSADLSLEAQEEAIARFEEQAHDAWQSGLDRAHDVLMAQLGQAHALQKGDQDLQASAALADQSHGNALDQQAAAAAAAPASGGAA